MALVAMTAIVLLIVAGSAGASWSGEPLPPWGSDWYIDEDTVYTDEVIDLYGSIYIDMGASVLLEGCTVTFDNDWTGHHGIEVWSGELYLMSSAANRMTVRSNASHPDWYFYVYDWMLHMEGTDLHNLTWGVQNYVGWYSWDPQPMVIEDCTITSNGDGVYASWNTTIIDSTVNGTSTAVYIDWGVGVIESSTLIAGYNYGVYSWADEIYIGNSTIISNDYRGVYSYSYDTTIVNCEISARSYGLYSSGSDTSIHGSRIVSTSDRAVYASSGTLVVEDCEIEGWTYGIYTRIDSYIGNSSIEVYYESTSYSTSDIYGIYSSGAKCRVYNLEIHVTKRIRAEYDTMSSMYAYSYVYGMYFSSSDIGVIDRIHIELTQDNELHNHYQYSSPRVYNYMYSYGIYMSGSTVCTALTNVTFDLNERFHGAVYNATSRPYVYFYSYPYLVYSTISGSGKAPIDVGYITINGAWPTFTQGGQTDPMYNMYIYEYYSSRYFLYFSESTGTRDSEAVLRFHDIAVSDSMAGYVLYLPRYTAMLIEDCTFKDMQAYYIIYGSSLQSDLTMQDCTFLNASSIENPMYTGRPLVYIDNIRGELTIRDNMFVDVTGTSLMWIRYPYDKSIIENNTFSNNRQWTNTGDDWIYFYYNYGRMTVIDNVFADNDMRYFINIYYARERFFVTENSFERNVVSGRLLYISRNYDEVAVELNTFDTNTGRVFDIQYNYQRVTFEKNTITKNSAGSDYMVYTYETRGELRFSDNTIDNNTADGALFYFQGVTYFYWPGYAIFAFERNTLSDNVASAANNGGIIVIKGARYDTPVRRNTFVNNVGNCINFYRPYTSNSFDTTYIFTVDGNHFINNTDTASLWVDVTGYFIVVKKNTGTGNRAPLVRMVMEDHYVYDSSTPRCYGEIRGPYRVDVEGNVWNNNHLGAVDVRAQWVDLNTRYTAKDQSISVRNNDFRFNTGDYCIKLIDFGAEPMLLTNDVDGSDYGYYLQAIEYYVLWPRLQLDIQAESFDGGANGMTVWALVNADADFTECTFLNYKEALYVKDGTINVWWSAIPEASGRTEGRGYIYVNNHLELYITWANAEGVDSGMSAPKATVSMRGINGRYFPERLTDVDGRIGPLIVQPWTSIEGRLDIWSPFATSVVSGGLTGDYTVSAVGERWGPDSVHLIIQDIVVPEVIVTAPSNGSVVNLRNLPIDGFMFEIGSGVETFRGWVDTEEPIEITPMTVWSAQFRSLMPGEHTMWLEVKDRSGNMDIVELEFTIDAKAPTLSIAAPVQGLITRDPQVYIQGMYSDDLSELTDIVVRINNALVTEGSPGTLNYPFTLSEGVNAIVVDATDAAGNRAVVTLTVMLDTYPPTLYITSPLDGLLTADRALLVQGVSDADTAVKIEVIKDGVVKETEMLTTLGDGTFIVSIALSEGEQVIKVTATDSPANNNRVVQRMVTLDTTPPSLTITSPTEDTVYIKSTTMTLAGSVADARPDLVIVRVNNRPIEHSGMFSVPVSLMEGPNTIVVTAEDPAGNMATKMLNIIRDTVPPMLDVETPEYLLTRNPDLVVKGIVNRDADTVTVMGDQVNVDLDGRFSTSVDLSVESSPIAVVATDKAGNVATYEIEFLYDGAKPTLSIDTVPSQTSRAIAFINGTVSDDKSQILTVMIMGMPFHVIDGKFNAIVNLKTTGDGWNNFTVEAQDDAGNKATLRVNVQYVPPMPPKDEGTEGVSNEALSWVGVIFLAAGTTLLVTAWVLSKREVRK